MSLRSALRAVTGRELLASVVVFLVALPLCMGIAIASGAPPALGLVSGIVGGLVVGTLAGAPLQVSGPAAGLAVMVWELIQRFGLEGLGVAVLLAGALQVLAGVLRVGRWFRAVSPAVIQGMLAGIGVLILAGQFHVMLDDKPKGGGLDNLLAIPGAVMKTFVGGDGSAHHLAAVIGVGTIAVLVLWNMLRRRAGGLQGLFRIVPAPLVAVVAATGVAAFFSLPIQYVDVPASLGDAISPPGAAGFALLLDPAFVLAAVALAIIASAESLLCATATDQLHDGPRTKYDRELVAQGAGNMVSGLLGALPVTGVIVRSTANVEAGAKTRASAILHGVWMLVLVGALPFVLELIPTASLAAILVYTGYKLLNPAMIRRLAQAGRAELVIYAGTVVGIVCTDLLTGVLTGLGLAVARVLYRVAHLDVQVEHHDEHERTEVRLAGVATFLRLPRLAEALESIPPSRRVRIDLSAVRYLDHACVETIEQWKKQYRGAVAVLRGAEG